MKEKPHLNRLLVLLALWVTIAGGCRSVTPLAPLLEQKNVTLAETRWSIQVGEPQHPGGFFQPVVADGAVYSANSNGEVVKIVDGEVRWRVTLAGGLSSGTASDGITVIVASPQGQIIALNAETGANLWRSQANGIVLQPALVHAGKVIVRSSNNRLESFSALTGEHQWEYSRATSALTLYNYGRLMPLERFIISGFPDGTVAAIQVNDGVLVWQGVVSLAEGVNDIERVNDVLGTPAIYDNLICAVSFQGATACFDIDSGKMKWSRNEWGKNGASIGKRQLYVVNHNSEIIAFDFATGRENWRQPALAGRELTATVEFRGQLIAADGGGWLHFLDSIDGELLSRARIENDVHIRAQPIVYYNDIIVQTTSGRITAIKLP